MGGMPHSDALVEAVREALTGVLDPEIRRPITDLGMVRSVQVDAGRAPVGIDVVHVESKGGEAIAEQVRAVLVELARGVDGRNAHEIARQLDDLVLRAVDFRDDPVDVIHGGGVLQ